MKSSVGLSLIAVSAFSLGLVTNVSAQKLVADYEFQNSYSSSVSGAPDLADLVCCGANAFGSDTVFGASRTALFYPQGNGVELPATNTILTNNGIYTIAVLLRFDDVDGYRRILDFKHGTSDNGLYNYYGQLYFYPYSDLGGNIVANHYVTVVLTRDATGMITGYANGVKAFSFDDSVSQDGVIDSNNELRFFQDNGGPSESASGAVARIQVWDGALNGAQVAAVAPIPTIFKIDSLTTNNVSTVAAQSQIGDDRGGIAASNSKVFLTGDNNTGIWNRDDLTSPSTVGAIRDGLVADLHTQKIYTFANSSGTPVPSGSVCIGQFTISQLVELDPITGGLSANTIALSQPITISGSSCNLEAGVFSGYDRIVLVDGPTRAVYNIDLPRGTVTNVGVITDSNYLSRSGAENWATWGVAEFFNGSIHLVYILNTHFVYRTDVATNTSEQVVDFFPQNISDGHEFTVVPSLNRWYFHYEGCGFDCASSDENLGFADATFTIGTLYAANGAAGNNNAHLFLLSPLDGSIASDLGAIGFAITGLAFDPTTGILYGSVGRAGNDAENLVTIDPFTAGGTLVGPYNLFDHTMADLTFTSDGTLYGWAEPGFDDLCTIDKSNGQATDVGDSGLSTGGSGLAANSHNVIYYAGNGGHGPLYTINRLTGAPSFVGTLNGPSTRPINALAFDSDDNLYGASSSNDLYGIDPATAAVTDLGPTISNIDAIAFPPVRCDSNPPVITTPGNITVLAQKKKVNGQRGAFVCYSVSAVDPEDGPVPVVGVPPIGTFFPVGTTLVTVTATDSCGNTATAQFTITVVTKKKRNQHYFTSDCGQ